jgi:hypothetical protein
MGSSDDPEVISLRYTIDFPKMELHPFNTKLFSLFYADEQVDANYHFNKKIEMQALSRQSRDLIALAIKCFSAHTYFSNSKIISCVST